MVGIAPLFSAGTTAAANAGPGPDYSWKLRESMRRIKTGTFSM